MKIQKKHFVIAALVLALGAAVYVNWQITDSSAGTASKELGAASYVNAEADSATDDEVVQTSAASSELDSYFAAERTKRQTTQDKIIDEASEILDIENVSDEDMTEAQKSVENMMKIFTIQDSIESIVKAKGFSECLCFISDEGVTVIVPESELEDTSALLIDDAVTSHYDVDCSKISIVGA